MATERFQASRWTKGNFLFPTIIEVVDSVFHPKTYVFVTAPGDWECLIGSPNFTKGGLNRNHEMAVLITSNDAGARPALDRVNAHGRSLSIACL
jgi:phosphatidylserine/phosphatidylglycerophosphate/cardiolipin synthase-like enzyme